MSSVLTLVPPPIPDVQDVLITKMVCPGQSRLVPSKLYHRLVCIFKFDGNTILTLIRGFVLGFWFTSHLISFIPIYERDIPLKDESIRHEHTHER
jgi:hypothetical protein